jgi:hypothetical protein
MSADEKRGSYDPSGIGILEKGLQPIRRDGLTITHDPDMDMPEQKINACCALLLSDESLWHVSVTDRKGRTILAYRDPHP